MYSANHLIRVFINRPHRDKIAFCINLHIKPSELYCTFFVGAGGKVLLRTKIVFTGGYVSLWTGPRQQGGEGEMVIEMEPISESGHAAREN